MYYHARLSNCLNLDSMAQFYTLQESFSKLVFLFFFCFMIYSNYIILMDYPFAGQIHYRYKLHVE